MGPQVFMGYREQEAVPKFLAKPGASRVQRVPQYVPLDFAKTQANMLSAQESEKLMQVATEMYGYTPSYIVGYKPTWENLVDLSYQIKTQYGQNVAPLAAWDWWKERTGQSPKMFGSKTGGGTTRARTRAREETVSLTDPGTARTLVDQALESFLGRSATDQEFKNFSRALQGVEEANPVITEQETRRADGTTRTTTTREGGMNAQSFAQAWARGQEGSAEYTAATSLMDAFTEAIIGETL
jgi:hypothetical protein